MFGVRLLKRRCSSIFACERSFVRRKRTTFFAEGSKGWLALTTAGAIGVYWASKETASQNFHSEKCWQLLMSTCTTLSTFVERTRMITTQMDYLEHDEEDYDIYIKNPTVDDLPYLLNQFDEHGKEVWPWIWTHPNEAGPHIVYIGVNVDTLEQIRKLRSKSTAYNILVIASEEVIVQAANDAGDPKVYEETHCGIVSDATLELLNVNEKILMLSDERVISFDSLTII